MSTPAPVDHRRARPRRRSRQAVDVARRIQPAAALVHQDAVIGVAADLAALIGARHEVHRVMEHAREQLLLVAKGVEVRTA